MSTETVSRRDEQGYNGWKNYPTWAVHLWLTNDEVTYRECVEAASMAREGETPRVDLADGLKRFVRDSTESEEASLAADLLGYALDCVDWYEVADSFLEE